MLVLKLALYALVFIAGFSFIQVLFAFLLLYLESSLNTHITKPITSKPTTVKMVGLFFFEWIFKLFLKLVSYPILFLNSKAKHVAHSKSCIILLHGYSRNAVDWLWFKKHLQANGKDIMALTLPLVTRDLQTSAKDLSAELHKLKAQHGYEEFILIGHSMGG
ncbi:MAG: hypothetical protein HOI53_02155, partial [Francisellaceae bacterium]|nr:hypothetical protein [Francisellaceae bacterium]